MRIRGRRSFRITPLVQGAFFVGAGLWPLVHIRSFQLVTGPKADRWLVKTIGALLATIGASLMLAGRERSPSRALPVLGVGSAAALGLADVIYVSKGRISPVYLADAFVQAGILTGWWREIAG